MDPPNHGIVTYVENCETIDWLSRVMSQDNFYLSSNVDIIVQVGLVASCLTSIN